MTYHLSDATLEFFESHFNQVNSAVYRPQRELSIDELSYPYKGRSKHRCYNPLKPAKWHLRFYGFNDSSQFLYKVHFYWDSKEKKKTIPDLISSFLNSLDPTRGPSRIFADNYYGGLESIRLANKIDHPLYIYIYIFF